MKKVIILLSLFLVGFVQNTSALSCMYIDDNTAINSASSVFVGKVLSVDNEKVLFEISKYWKGNLNQTQTIFGTTYWTGLPGGNIFYNIGQEYIVYTTNVNGQERSSIDCGRTQKYDFTAEQKITNYLGTPKYFNIVSPVANYCSYANQINANIWMGNWKNKRVEVQALQNYLFGYYGVLDEVRVSGYFGRLTKNYVAQFQREHNLYPVTGGMGPLTRNKMKSLCGVVGGDIDQYGCIGSAGYTWCAVKNKCLRSWEESCGKQDDSAGGANCKVYYDGCNTCSRSYVGGPAMCTLMACMNTGNNIWNSGAYCKEYFTNNVNTAPVVKSFTGPVSLKVGEKGTWKIEASSYNNQSLSYNVSWGDEGTELYRTSAPLSMSAIFNQQTTFEHTYSRSGTFTVRVTVTSQDGQTTNTTQTVNVLQNDVAYCTSEYNPVCGQPQYSCPPGAYCTMMMPAPRTYSNICLMNRDNASLLYYGSCR